MEKEKRSKKNGKGDFHQDHDRKHQRNLLHPDHQKNQSLLAESFQVNQLKKRAIAVDLGMGDYHLDHLRNL